LRHSTFIGLTILFLALFDVMALKNSVRLTVYSRNYWSPRITPLSTTLSAKKQKLESSISVTESNSEDELVKADENDQEGEFGAQNANDEENILTIAKLKAEASAPFRLFRQFVFGGAVGAGGLGFVATCPQLIKAVTDEDRTQTLTNLAIDFGAIAIGGYLWKVDTDKGKEKIEQFAGLQKKLVNQLSPDAATEQETLIGMLPVEIIFSLSDENVTRIIPLNELGNKGEQNVVIVAGKFDFLRDSIIGARAEGDRLFTASQTYIIPFCTDEGDQPGSKPVKGFGTPRPGLLTAPYIGKPQQPDVWRRILETEFKLAEAQGSKQIRDQGMVLVINRNGKVVRRGVGIPPWDKLVETIK